MKKTRNKRGRSVFSLLLALALTLSLLPPVGARAATGGDTVRVRVVGADSVMLDKTMNIADVTDYTPLVGGEGEKNALDAVLSATLQNGYDASSYTISYSAQYASYSMSKLANVEPSGAYWGTMVIGAAGAYDRNALSSHALDAGDTYLVTYCGYGQSCAWFASDTAAVSDTASGAAGSPVTIRVDGLDTFWNAGPLSGMTVYAEGGDYPSATAVGVTDETGKAYIPFGKAGTYTLTLAAAYTYSKCEVTVTGSDVALTEGDISVAPAGAKLTLTKGSVTWSPYAFGGGTRSYRLADGTYDFAASADGYWSQTGTITVADGAASPDAITLTALSGFPVTLTAGTSGDTIILRDAAGAEKTAGSHAGTAWVYDLTNGSYTYTVSRNGYHSVFGSFTVSGAAVDVTLASPSDDAAAGADDWYAFRGDGNMAIVASSTPKGVWQTEEAWSTSLGALGSWGTLSASNIVQYDGYLYVATEHGLSKLDASDGTLVKTTPLAEGTSYVLETVYGGGKVFVTTDEGIDAFDARTMEYLWTAFISEYGDYMASTPILYDGATNTVYVGDYGDAASTPYGLGTYGGYSAINAETGAGKWIYYGGSEADAKYWAGAVIAGDYLVFGSNDGVLRSVSADPADYSSGYARAAGTLSVTGMIQSSIANDGSYLYFTTKSGCIYKVSVGSDGALTEVSSRQFTTGSSTSTPVVYGGRVYVGASDGIYVLNAADFSQEAFVTTSSAVASSALLTTAYEGADGLYVYFTVNGPRGELIVLKDTGTAVTSETMLTPAHAQYCMNSLIAGGDGTLYYANDSGYVTAVSSTGASSADLAKVSFSVTPASVFDSTTYATEYPTIRLYSNQTAVPTPSAGIYYLAAGTYSYSVSLTGYYSYSNTFTVAAGDLKAIPVALSQPSSSGSNEITVRFALKGFSTQPSTTLTMQKGCTITDVISAASSELGFTVTGLSGGYIKSVTYNGVTNTEFGQGKTSGWIYQVGTSYPKVGVDSFYLSESTSVTLEYTTEYDPYMWGDSPTQGGQVPVVINGNTLQVKGEQDGNNLSLTLDASTVSSLIAGRNSAGVVTLDVSSVSGVDEVTLEKSALTSLSGTSSVTGVTLKTKEGAMTLGAAALKGILARAGDEEITFRAAEVSPSGLSAGQKQTVGSNPVFELAVHSGGTPITQFDGDVTVSIPYTPTAAQSAEGFKVFYVDAAGALQEMTGARYDAASGCIVFTTTHFSLYMIAYRPFADVSAGAWYYAAAYRCLDKGVMNGTAGNAFSPDSAMTREMFVTILYRFAGTPAASGAPVFSDGAQISAWAKDAVLWASANGIVSGYPDGTFAPRAEITREQMAKILYAFAAQQRYDVTETGTVKLLAFSDGAQASSWAQSSLSWAVNAGLMNGNGNGTVTPQGGATRAQVAQILCNLMDWTAKA